MKTEDISVKLREELNKRFEKELVIYKDLELNNNRTLYSSMPSMIFQIFLNAMLLLFFGNIYVLIFNVLFIFFVIFHFTSMNKYFQNKKIKTQKINLNFNNIKSFCEKRKEEIEELLLKKSMGQMAFQFISILYTLYVFKKDENSSDYIAIWEFILIMVMINVVLIVKESEYSSTNEVDKSFYKLVNIERLETNKILYEMGFYKKEIQSTLYIKNPTS